VAERLLVRIANADGLFWQGNEVVAGT
jgi:hypothetical protein